MNDPKKTVRIIVRYLPTVYAQTGEPQVEIIQYHPHSGRFIYSFRERASQLEKSMAEVRRPLEMAGNHVEVIEQRVKDPSDFNKAQVK